MGSEVTKYNKRLAELAQKYTETEKAEGTWITMPGGILTYGEDALPGNQMLAVVLDVVHENTYYEGDYDPDNPTPPICYALGRSDDEMEPHPEMDKDDYFEPQAEWCDECPWLEWGSADKGKGKACKERRRLALIPAGHFVKGKRRGEYDMEVYEDLDHFQSADIALLKIPVTSVKSWSKYVRNLAQQYQRPPLAVLTHIYVEPDPKVQFKVYFEPVEVIEDDALLDVLLARHEEAQELIEQPYSPPDDNDDDEPAKSKLKDLQKRRGR